MTRHLVVLLLSTVILAGCSPSQPPDQSLTSIAQIATPTSAPVATKAPTATDSPTETPSPAPTLTSTRAKASEETLQAYSTLVLIKVNQVLLEETAIAIRDEKLTGLNSFGALIAVASLISATEQSLAQPAPEPNLESAWEEGKAANAALKDIVARWLDKEITSKEVLEELPDVASQIDEIIQSVQAALAGSYDIDIAKLQDDYDAAVEKAHEDFQKLLMDS